MATIYMDDFKITWGWDETGKKNSVKKIWSLLRNYWQTNSFIKNHLSMIPVRFPLFTSI